VRGGADEWLLLPAEAAETSVRLPSAVARLRRREAPRATTEAAEHLRYEELLYDRFTGFPTLPVMLERAREMLERRGRLTILYIEFVRYSKLEEIYGWEKLDEVLQTTANRRCGRSTPARGPDSLMMVSHTGDDDFVFFTDLPDPVERAEQRINEMATRWRRRSARRLEAEHGEDIAGLFEIYVGSSTIFRNPKIRTERIIYRGIREAAQAARERGAPRALAEGGGPQDHAARGCRLHRVPPDRGDGDARGLRLRGAGARRAPGAPLAGGALRGGGGGEPDLGALAPLPQAGHRGDRGNLEPHHLLFLNIDPHDFRDPTFRYLDLDELGVEHPERIVLEITERTAITDYPKFQGYLREFRERGFRFAVDDAGSGYAGLGSIANLEPDFIKLDISLISGIDTNFMKQNLVETMVSFANDHGIKVIGEGVEREEEYEAVKRLGVHSRRASSST
jgi:GGDEF domain-containing protein